MNKALKSALIELRNDGVTLDPIADLDHILTLNTLALEISSPRAVPGEDMAFAPVLRIGNVTLRHLSLGARRFLVDVVGAWYPSDVRMQDLAYAYCMAVGDCPERLWEIQSDRRAFKKRVKSWEKTVGVSYGELKAAIKAFQNDEDRRPGVDPSPRDYRAALDLLDGWKPMPEAYKLECEAALISMLAERQEKPSFYGQIIETLVKEYGKSPEDWIWRTSGATIEFLFAAMNERVEAEARSIKGAQDDRFMRAHHAFVQYKDIVMRLKKGLK